MPTQVIGFDEDALTTLKEYSWLFNIDQLKQVIRELLISSDSEYITRQNVERILQKYRSTWLENSDLNLNLSLAEIELQIIRRVLKDEKGNQVRAAERLGISRSTMWRRLQSDAARLSGGI